MVTPGWFLRMCLDSRVGEKGWQRDERKQGRMKKKATKRDCPEGRGCGMMGKGVSARCLRPLQLLPPHFVAWRHFGGNANEPAEEEETASSCEQFHKHSCHNRLERQRG